MNVKKRDNLSISPWIQRFSGLIPDGGTVLDLAAGGGRHALWLFERGYRVTALDRRVDALNDLKPRAETASTRLELVEADLEDGSPWPLRNRRFDAIIVVNYLWRPLFPSIIGALAEDGLLLYETFASGNGALGKPSNPDFLLQPGELLDAVSPSLHVIAYEHGRIEGPAGPAIKQWIAATSATPPTLLPTFQGCS